MGGISGPNGRRKAKSEKSTAAPWYWHANRRREAIQQIVIHKGTDILDIEALHYVAQAMRIIKAGRYGILPVGTEDVIERLTDWARQYSPGEFSLDAIEAAAKAAMKGWPHLAKDAEVGQAFEITYDQYVAWSLKTIQPMDCSRKELERRNRRRWHQARLKRNAQERRKRGNPTRAEWLAAHSISARKPWEDAGMSRCDWYRKGKPSTENGAVRQVGAIHETGRCADNLLNGSHQPVSPVTSTSTAPKRLPDAPSTDKAEQASKAEQAWAAADAKRQDEASAASPSQMNSNSTVTVRLPQVTLDQQQARMAKAEALRLARELGSDLDNQAKEFGKGRS